MKYCILFLIVPFTSLGQAHQERQVFIYNVALGGITSGIGAIINKPKSENWKTAFSNGFWQGSIGGILSYSGKKTVYFINKNQSLNYAWPSKLLHAAATSIIENAAQHEPFLNNWNLEVGIVRLDLSLKRDKNFRIRFLPQSIQAIYFCSKNSKFDLSSSLLTGNLIFKSKEPWIRTNTGLTDATTYWRGITYVDNSRKYYLLSHEIIHLYQYRDLLIFNSWLKPVASKIKSNLVHKIFDHYVYPDIPYFYLFYNLEGRFEAPYYYKNFFEFEAERFATNKYVPLN